MNFIYKIATRDRGELVPLTFVEDSIKIRIILAVSDVSSSIDTHSEKSIVKVILEINILHSNL